MDSTIADRKQINGEVRERNRFYRALVRIHAIAADDARTNNAELNLKLERIDRICKESLKQNHNRRN